MISKWTGFIKGTILLVLFTSLAVFFQNCSRVGISGSKSSSFQMSGEPFTGMVSTYRYFDSSLPCGTTDVAGNPLPNEEILFKADNAGNLQPYLARQSCQDLAMPTQIPADEIQVLSQSEIKYQNTAFTSANPPGQFDIVSAACPAGTSPIPNAVRTNEFTSALDWMVSTSLGWKAHQGIAVNFFNTIDSLPAYSIERNDGNYLDSWRSVFQSVLMSPNTNYSFTFLAQPQTVHGVLVTLYRNLANDPTNSLQPIDEDFNVFFDLKAETATVYNAQNITNVTATVTPVGNAFLCTIYFTSSATDDQSPAEDINISPNESGNFNAQQAGDSITATDAQLVKVNDFCQ